MRVASRSPTLPSTATVTTAVDKSPASARLSAVATAGDLPTAPTPCPGTRPNIVQETHTRAPFEPFAERDRVGGIVMVSRFGVPES